MCQRTQAVSVTAGFILKGRAMGVKEVRKFKQPQPNTFLSYVKKTTGGGKFPPPPPPAGIGLKNDVTFQSRP